ncbi:MAG: hypothetical protein HYX24_05790 [Candidatus Aenigmarchaeota archaeon]|nr:hypothetical protein [Candidatus Aenigmarchaeota archaeon]
MYYNCRVLAIYVLANKYQYGLKAGKNRRFFFYEKVASYEEMNPTKGYWVKVKKACTTAS